MIEQKDRRHAVVTGIGNGIGAAIGRDLAEAGWDITGVDVRADAAHAVLGEIADATGARTVALIGDLADAHFAADIVRAAWHDAPVDGLVNAAGIYPAIPFFDIDADKWNRVQAINVTAPLLATQALGALAAESGTKPAVVNITSGAATRARPGTAHYSTSKAALTMVTKACAIELAPYGVRVNAVAPGFFPVASEVNPISDEYASFMATNVLPGEARTEYVAGAVRFLLSNDAHWITGASVPVDGGATAGTRNLPQHWAGTSVWQQGIVTEEASA